MRSSSTAKKFPAESQAVRALRAIKKFITPLAPPVLALEKSIRATPFKILISVLLSSRTQDAVTEKAASRLFAAADTPRKMLSLNRGQVERLIYPVGFFHTKAKNILKICAILAASRKFPASAGRAAGPAGHRPQIGQPGAGPGLLRAGHRRGHPCVPHLPPPALGPRAARPPPWKRNCRNSSPAAPGRGSTRRWWDSGRRSAGRSVRNARSAC